MGIYQWPREYPQKTITYSLRKGNVKLSAHFHLKEFQSKDGADTIVVCPYLLQGLEKLFTHMNAYAINITSGYRTISHSLKVGGSGAKDNHHLGQAADIKVKKTATSYYTAKEVACALQAIGWEHGIGLMNTSVHVDAGSKYWFDETRKSGGSYVQVADWYNYTGIAKPVVSAPTVQPSAPSAPTSTHKYKIGDTVVFSTCYKSSTAPNREAIAASKMSRNHGVITKIVEAKNPYLLDNGFCWVNDGDIRGYYTAATSKPAHQGKPYILTCSSLNIRSGPGKKYNKIGELKKGQVFYVTHWTSDGWAHLEQGGYAGAKKYCKEKK